MGSRRTLALVLSALAAPAAAGPASLPDFAACAGRYAATVEHLWLTDGAAADRAARARDAFADLDAATDPGGPWALHRRIEAKAAQRALWERATFAGDARAARLARDWIARCDSLLPGM
ncbi:MAG TPA: hypothetical protein PKD10_07395 [Paracoccaceae bacterium]|nr:hypothetical protein [Paracoccaceae bacterium]HMO70513.1 hypothetical protein [Paracoccaceae bacterium]